MELIKNNYPDPYKSVRVKQKDKEFYGHLIWSDIESYGDLEPLWVEGLNPESEKIRLVFAEDFWEYIN